MKQLSCNCGPRCGCKNCACSAHASFFGALANENRLQIVLALRDKAQSVTELGLSTGIEQSAISHALRQLQDVGITSSKRSGRSRIYSLNREVVEPLWILIEPHVKRHSENLSKPCVCQAEEGNEAQ